MKSREETHLIIQTRIDSNNMRLLKLKQDSYPLSESGRLDTFKRLHAENDLLETVLSALCDGRPTEEILKTGFCRGWV